MDRLNEPGFYTLAGAPRTPRDLIAEVQQADFLDLGSAFISERFNIEEAAAATSHNTRHPMVTAAFAMTVHRLTERRFELGLGCGIAPQFNAYGLSPIKIAQIEDSVGLMRRIWRGR